MQAFKFQIKIHFEPHTDMRVCVYWCARVRSHSFARTPIRNQMNLFIYENTPDLVACDMILVLVVPRSFWNGATSTT